MFTQIDKSQRRSVSGKFWRKMGRPATATEMLQRYVVKAASNECWLWTGNRFKDGYGSLWCDGRTHRAHRIAYTNTFGSIAPGLLVCHKCDVRLCCNPAHLFLGTHRDNIQDALSKGRMHVQPKGSRKFSVALVETVKHEYRQLKHPIPIIQQRHGLTYHQVRNLIYHSQHITDKTWDWRKHRHD